MKPERWKQVQALIADLEGRSEEERRVILDERCGDDEDLRKEVETLLTAATDAASYFDGLVERAITPFDRLVDQKKRESELTGIRLDQFEVVEKLGEGGMGEVYRATDTDLRRDVALKVLPEYLVHRELQVARFKREAQLLASLNHPSIGAIYGFEEFEGRHVLVLELVDGPTLAARMEGRRLPRDEALEIAHQVACALEAAHAVGIVHRDLKPANIKLTSDGKVKVLDFGIAKAVHGEPEESSDFSPSTTEILAATHTGEVVGTVSYMSPEQLKGKSVDTRSDVWAFGAVLFEMLAGHRPFQADGFALTLAKILEHPADWHTLPSDLPPELRRLLERCLERDIGRRLQAIGEARIVIEDMIAGRSDGVIPFPTASGASVPTSRAPSGWRRVAAWVAVVAIGAIGFGVGGLRPDPPAVVERFASPLRAGQEPVLFGVAAFNLSRDGSLLVYRGPGEVGSGNRLWVRRWDELDAFPLRGTEGGIAPSVSPDGRELVYSQNGEVRILSLAGGPARTVAQGINPTWAPDGGIFITVPTGTDWIPPGGGQGEPVTQRSGQDGNHFIIDLLPGEDAVLVSIDQRDGPSEIRVVDLESGESTLLINGTWPRYAETGHLVFLLDGSLLAAPFDADRRELLGPPVPLMSGVLAYAMADEGTLVYSTVAGAVGAESELIWVDREGNASPVEEGWTFDRGGANPGWSLSPDGSRIALRMGSEGGQDIWIKELDGGPLSRLTFHESEERKPQWSPDGTSVTFLSARAGDLDVWSRRADGTGEPTLVLDHSARIAEALWSPDGEWLVVRTAGAQDLAGGRDVLGFRPSEGGEAVPLLTGPYDEAAPAISPDGRWLAYSSTETGRYEVFVRPFPDVDAGLWQVTTEGGSAPQWAHNGRELFYVDAARRLVSVRYEAAPRFRVVGSDQLFTIPPGYDLAQVASLYDVTADDQTFLMARVYGAGGGQRAATPEVILVRNYFQELESQVPR